MEEQRQAAAAAMAEWLAHPSELGKRPTKLELAGTFELHGMRYYMFKFKKSMLGGWLLGVCGGYEEGSLEHCGHVLSRMEPYDLQTAQSRAEEMIEFIRAYWMEQAKQFQGGRGPEA